MSPDRLYCYIAHETTEVFKKYAERTVADKQKRQQYRALLISLAQLKTGGTL